MLNNLIFKSLPQLFILLFIFLEFTPNYLFEEQLIKPYLFFTVLYCWVSNDHRKFSPLSLFVLCTLYDLLKGDLIGITCLFFLFSQYSRRKQFNELISNEFKETWIKFILTLTTYISSILLIKLFFYNDEISFRNITISFLVSIALFPLFFSIVNKLSYKFKSYNE